MSRFFKFKYFVFFLLSILVLAIAIFIGGLLWSSNAPTTVVEGTVPDLTPVSNLETPQKQIDKKIPDEAKPCLPDEFATAVLMAKVKDGEQTLYHVRVMSGDDGVVPLISVVNDRCTVLNAEIANGGSVPLQSVVPNPQVLEKLIVQRFENTFKELGGKDKFQKMLDESIASGEIVAFEQENYDVLVKLGIKFPKDLRIIKSLQELEQ